MNDLEELLRDTLTDAARSAPAVRPLAEYRIDERVVAQPRRRWVAPLAAAFGAVAVVTAFVLVAGLLTRSHETQPAVPSDLGTPLHIPTSSWKPGDGAETALASGRLSVAADGCLLIGATVLVWPAGYTARYADDGLVRVMNPNGQIVAVSGQQFSAGGGFGPATSDMTNGGCLRQYADGFDHNPNAFDQYPNAFVIQQDLVPPPDLNVDVKSQYAGCTHVKLATSHGTAATPQRWPIPHLSLRTGDLVIGTAAAICPSLVVAPVPIRRDGIQRPTSSTMIVNTVGSVRLEVGHLQSCDSNSESVCEPYVTDGFVRLRVTSKH